MIAYQEPEPEPERRSTQPLGSAYNPLPLLDALENWLLDLVHQEGATAHIGRCTWHATPIDLFLISRKVSWTQADVDPTVQEYRRFISVVHPDVLTDIPAYEALAVVNLVKTLVRYRLKYA